MWDEPLIRLVEQHPMLYDRGNDNFRNVAIKKDKWKEISSMLIHEYGLLNLSGEECEQRWKQLREMFGRQHKKYTSSNFSGLKSGKEWHLYQSLSFLIDHLQQRVPKPIPVVASSSGLHRENFLRVEDEDTLHYIGYNAPEQASTSLTLPSFMTPSPIAHHSITNKLQPNHNKSMNCTISSTNVPPVKRKTPKPNRPSSNNNSKKQRISLSLKQSPNSLGSKKCCEVITEAVGTMAGFIKSVEEMDINLQCIKEVWNKVPENKKHQCLAEVLKTLVKFSSKNKD